MSQCSPCKYQDHGNCEAGRGALDMPNLSALFGGMDFGGSTSCECRDASPDLHRELSKLGGAS